MESAKLRDGMPGHVITSAVEHVAVKETCSYLEGSGYTVTYVGIDGLGVVSPASIVAAVQPSTRLITLMFANVCD
jgi:cysteine desulfurase